MKCARLGVLIGILGCVGCSDAPRSIATAKKSGDTEFAVPSEVPTQVAPAQSDPAAKTLVAEMLAAHTKGKPDAVRAFRSFENVRSGLILSNSQDPIYQTWTVRGEWPDRYHVRAEIAGLNTVALAWNGDKAWRQLLTPQPGPAFDLDAAELKSFKADATGEWLLLLFPLLEPETVVASHPAKTVRDKECPGVRVWHPALSEAVLYLDPATKELVQVTFNGRESLQVVVKEFIVLELMETTGVRLPSRVAQNASGRQLADWTFTRLEPKSHDAKLFDAPPVPTGPTGPRKQTP